MTHAGVEDGSLNLIVFKNQDELRGLLEIAGCTIDEHNVVHNKDGDIAACPSCNGEVKIDHVGHVLPGSQHIYCDRPVCIMDYLDRFS